MTKSRTYALKLGWRIARIGMPVCGWASLAGKRKMLCTAPGFGQGRSSP